MSPTSSTLAVVSIESVPEPVAPPTPDQDPELELLGFLHTTVELFRQKLKMSEPAAAKVLRDLADWFDPITTIEPNEGRKRG
jgi:hypothetical protein